jgi:hypothetical protein
VVLDGTPPRRLADQLDRLQVEQDAHVVGDRAERLANLRRKLVRAGDLLVEQREDAHA